MIKSVRAAMAGVAVAAAVVSCGPAKVAEHPVRQYPGAEDQEFRAGAHVVDITPPIHLALFGHGPESRVATGVRLRLRCQPIVIASGPEIVALVPCDLQSSSEALQRAVADKLRALDVPIGPDRLFIMATHTHMAPAHYFEPRRYSGVFSSILSGFDVKVLDHLASRISEGVKAAYDGLGPACVAWKQDLIGDAHLQLNRAYVPYLSNQPLYGGDPPTEVHPGYPVTTTTRIGEEAQAGNRPGAESAVDPTLSVLRIDRRAGAAKGCAGSRPMAALAVFGMHPTALPNTNSVYHGDIFGYATRAAEGKLTRRHYAAPGGRDAAWDDESAPPDRVDTSRVIVGLANGSDGDVSPRIYEQTEREARRLGHILGDNVATFFEAAAADLVPEGKVQRLYHELSFSQALANAKGNRLCEYGELGTVTGGGARDGPTRLRVIPELNSGFIPDATDPCHWKKLTLRDGAPGEWDYPRFGSIALVRVGGGVLATAPGEMTTMTSLRIKRELRGAGVDNVAIAGLTNQYLQYFATQEEYRYQYYEGASTLYGPYTEAFLSRQFGVLGGILRGHWDDTPGALHGVVTSEANVGQQPVNALRPFDRCHASPREERWPAHEEVKVSSASGLAVKKYPRSGVVGYELETEALSPLFTAWLDPDAPEPPPCDEPFSARKTSKVYRPLRVQVLQGSTVVDDDMGTNLEVQELDEFHWRVRWAPVIPTGDPRCGRQALYSIRVTVRASADAAPATLDSEAFPVDCAASGPRGGGAR